MQSAAPASAWPDHIPPRGEHHMAACHQTQRRQRTRLFGLGPMQLRPIVLNPGLTAQGRIQRHHRRPLGLGRIFQAVREQAHARLAEVAHPPWYARPERHQRALERIGQHIGGIKTALELPGKLTPRAPLQTAVSKGHLQNLRDLRHSAIHRRHPRQGGNGEPLTSPVQSAQQRLGHDRITDPLRGDDERGAHDVGAAGKPTQPAAGSMPSVKMLAVLELVDRAAVRATGRTGLGHIEVDPGVSAPKRHGRVGTEYAALGIEVAGQQFDRPSLFLGLHGDTSAFR